MASKRRIRRSQEHKRARLIAEHEPKHHGKQQYPHEHAARIACYILARLHPRETFSPYPCDVGELHWHAGHAPWFVRYGPRQRNH